MSDDSGLHADGCRVEVMPSLRRHRGRLSSIIFQGDVGNVGATATVLYDMAFGLMGFQWSASVNYASYKGTCLFGTSNVKKRLQHTFCRI